MNLLISKALWVNPGDPQSGKQLSVRVRQGKVVAFAPHLEPEDGEEIVQLPDVLFSPGWLDLKATAGEPGRHQNETLKSLEKAAAAGGFTDVVLQPDTRPIIQTPESVHFFKSYSGETGVAFRVAGAATLELKGEKMAEVLTMNSYGADAFATVHPIQNSGFFSRLLQYLTHTGKVLIHYPVDSSLVLNGQIHEGMVSDNRGLSGIPPEAEEIAVKRDLVLQQYSHGKLHLTTLSCAGSLAEIRRGRAAGNPTTCDVAAHQLAFTESALDQFDTVHKVFPPYRLESDRKALVDALHSGVIDAVVSDHKPWHYDYKDVEFEAAQFGISSLETTFAALCTFGEGIKNERLVHLLAIGPRRILGLEVPVLKEGMEARFTYFDPSEKWVVGRERWQSKSANNPFIGMELTGKVYGILTPNGFFPNPHTQSVS